MKERVYLLLRVVRSLVINKLIYRLTNVDTSSHLRLGSVFSKDMAVGKFGYFGPGAWVCPRVIIGNYFMAGPEVSILGGDHRFDLPEVPIIFSGRPEELEPTIIGDDVWVGMGAIINSGIKIGNGAIIAAGSVVVKDVPSYTIVGGNPAGILRERFGEGEKVLHEKMLRDVPKVGKYAKKKKY